MQIEIVLRHGLGARMLRQSHDKAHNRLPRSGRRDRRAPSRTGLLRLRGRSCRRRSRVSRYPKPTSPPSVQGRERVARIWLLKNGNHVKLALWKVPLLSYAKAAAGGPQRRTRGESAPKNFLRDYPCNPLISLISHERIQGNPRKSNAQNLGFRAEFLGGQENPS